jgi:hypothetical protein
MRKVILALIASSLWSGTSNAETPYGHVLIGWTGLAGIRDIDPGVSINDQGRVAYLAEFLDGNNQIVQHVYSFNPFDGFIYDISTNITAALSQRFFPSCQITDQSRVIVRRRQDVQTPLGVSVQTFIETWGAASPGQSILARGDALVGEFDALFPYASMNNSGSYVFGALDGGQNYIGNFNSGSGVRGTYSGTLPVRLSLADDGYFVFTTSAGNLLLVTPGIASASTIASPAGFGAVGLAPSISDDGNLIAFIANPGQGNGIYLSVKRNGQFDPPIRIMGQSFDGRYDVGEAWNDSNNNGVFDPGEDSEGFDDFTRDSRVSVSSMTTLIPNLAEAWLCFRAIKGGDAGVFSLRVRIDTMTGGMIADRASTVGAVGMPVSAGLSNYVLSDVGVWDSINARGEVVFWGSTQAGGQVVVKSTPRRKPVMIIPGIFGTLHNRNNPSASLREWALNRGYPPEKLQIDPLAHTYDDLIQTLRNAGYREGEDLFIVNYDWRLPPAPFDGTIDGHVSSITADSLTDASLETAADYLGLQLRAAALSWKQRFGGDTLPSVDVIAHSTGGLIARAYIQSGAYGDAFSGPSGPVALPTVDRLILMAVPNLGAPKAWNPLHDNWAAEKLAYHWVMSKYANAAFEKARTTTIHGPDYDILPSSNRDPAVFIRQYIPTIQSLLATTEFLDGSDVNATLLGNRFLLDLNAGRASVPAAGNARAFANLAQTMIIAGTGVPTVCSATTHVGPADNVFRRMGDYRATDVAAGQTFYDDVLCDLCASEPESCGDGTVPRISGADFADGDPRFEIKRFEGLNHGEIVALTGPLSQVCARLGVPVGSGTLSTGRADLSVWRILRDQVSIILDPVDGYVEDSLGRRLGFTAATGALTEIPGSVWDGDADGLGFAWTGTLQPPLQLHLFGRGTPFYTQVAVTVSGFQGGVNASGILLVGEQRVLPIRLFGDCEADLDDGSALGVPDGGVTLEDLLFFLDAYALGGLAADLDDGTGTGSPDGGVTLEDLLFFLAHYEAGC